MESNLLICSFTDFVFGVLSNFCLIEDDKDFLLYFPLEVVYNSYSFIFRSMIHLVNFFISVWIQVHLFAFGCAFVQHHFANPFLMACSSYYYLMWIHSSFVDEASVVQREKVNCPKLVNARVNLRPGLQSLWFNSSKTHTGLLELAEKETTACTLISRKLEVVVQTRLYITCLLIHF